MAKLPDSGSVASAVALSSVLIFILLAPCCGFRFSFFIVPAARRARDSLLATNQFQFLILADGGSGLGHYES